MGPRCILKGYGRTELQNGTENLIKGLDKNVSGYCIRKMLQNFFQKKVRSPEDIEKDVIAYLQKELVNTNYKNCYTYKNNENKIINRPKAFVNEQIPKDDFTVLDAEMKSVSLPYIIDIATRNNLFKKAEITHVLKSPTGRNPDPIGPDYYVYNNKYNGFSNIGKYYYSEQHLGFGDNFRNPEPSPVFITETNIETRPGNYVAFEYTPPVAEADVISIVDANVIPEAKLVKGGKPKKTRRRKNKKRLVKRRSSKK